MTVPITRQPNIDDQTIISLTLFNTILETTNNRAELHNSWEVISIDIRIHEQWESQQRLPRNQPPH